MTTFSQDRKLWGWGLASYQVPPPLLDLARAFLSAKLGCHIGESRPVPSLESIRLPAPVGRFLSIFRTL